MFNYLFTPCYTIDKSNKGSIPKHMQFHRRKKRDCKKVKYKTSDSKHLTVIPAFVWTISSEQQHQCTCMIIDKH